MTATVATTYSSGDRAMRRLLRVEGDPVPGAVFDAQNKLRSSIVISGIRCIITYLLVPFAAPIVGLSGALAAPLSIALSLAAMALSYQSLRRFWIAHHRLRWHYTAFIAVVWLLLVVGIAVDVAGLV